MAYDIRHRVSPAASSSACCILLAVWIGCALGLVACARDESKSTAGEPAAERSHLLLITVDTWRADHFLEERAGVHLTPNLSRLAQQSVRFSDASSVSTCTSPGVAGILTGLYPRRSGVIVNQHQLPPNLPTLATLLQDQGFVTGAFVANPVLAAGNGFDRGFSRYEWVRREGTGRKTRAAAVSSRALEWLDEVSSKAPIFLWAHFMEPHGPYEPPEDVRSLFKKESFQAPTDIPLLPEGDNSGWHGIPDYQQSRRSPSTDGRSYLLNYAAEVRSLDQQVGHFLEEIDARGFLDSSVVVLTSDHGEALVDDHGYYFSHCNNLTEDQVAVPLLLYYPSCQGGAVVSRPVSTADIVPTVLELFGIRATEAIDGSSLLSQHSNLVVSQTLYESSLRDGFWKLRFRRRGNLSLVDLRADPAESTDLSTIHALRLRRMRRNLMEIRRRPALAESVHREPITEEHRERLKALGYL